MSSSINKKCYVNNLSDYPGINWEEHGFCLSPRHLAEVLFTGVEEVTDSCLDEFPSLELVASRTTSRDNVSTHKVPTVFLGKEDVADVRSAAEFTVMLMLMLLKRIKLYTDGCADRYRLIGRDLHNKTIGIFGYGRLGKMVGDICSAFDMNIFKCTRHTSSKEREDIFRESDIISLHLPAVREFNNFINRNTFNMMRKTAIVINTARPYMVDKDALLWALEDNNISGAALDYLGCDTEEPDIDLVEYSHKHDNLILTPHLGGNSQDAMNKVAYRLVEKVKEYYERGH